MFILTAGSLVVIVTANPSPQPSPKVIVISPQEASNSSYVILDLTVSLYGRFLYGSESHFEGIKWLTYSIDRTLSRQEDISLSLTKVQAPEPENRYRATAILPNLSDGVHSVTIQGETTYPFNNTIYEFVRFIVDTQAPKISIASPQNKTYNATVIQLNFVLNEESNATYILDGQSEVYSAKNTTILDLPNGHHNLTIYAIDDLGNVGKSEAVYFTISKEVISQATPSASTLLLENYQTLLIVGCGFVLAAIVSIFLLCYIRNARSKSVK